MDQLDNVASVKSQRTCGFSGVFLVVRHRQTHTFISFDKIKSSFVTVITGRQIRAFGLTAHEILYFGFR